MSGPLDLMERWLRKGSQWAENAAVVIDYAHYESHKGATFRTGSLITGVADDGQTNLLFWNPLGADGKEAHIAIEVLGGGRAFAHLYEGITIQATGTYVEPVRLNRRIQREGVRAASQWKSAYGAAIKTLGTKLGAAFIPGSTGTNPNAARGAGDVRTGLEWAFDPNYAYLIVVHNDSGATVPFSITLEYYEETPDELGEQVP